jgi:prolipoprotein diacylglyceryltransferase
VYSLITIGPLRLSTYGVCLLIALYVWWSWSERRASGRLPEWFLPTIIAASWLGGRFGVIVAQPSTLSDMLGQLLSVRILEYSWWSASTIALLTWVFIAKRRALSFRQSFVPTIVPLLVAYGIATTGATIGGVTVGTPTNVLWSIELYGQMRHPTGIYEAVIVWVGAVWLFMRERSGLSVTWESMVIYALCVLITGGLYQDGVVMAGGLHVVQVVALFTLFVCLQRVMMQAQKHN